MADGARQDEDEDDRDVRQHLAGDAQAFARVVRRHQGWAQQFTRWFLRDAPQAVDAAQRAFIELHRALPAYDARGQLRAFLRRVLIRQCLMEARSRDSFAALRDRNQAQAPAQAATNAHDDIVRREFRARAQRALAELSDEHRVVFLMRALDDASYEEIGAVLGRPRGTLARWHSEARATMRKLLGDDEERP